MKTSRNVAVDEADWSFPNLATVFRRMNPSTLWLEGCVDSTTAPNAKWLPSHLGHHTLGKTASVPSRYKDVWTINWFGRYEEKLHSCSEPPIWQPSPQEFTLLISVLSRLHSERGTLTLR